MSGHPVAGEILEVSEAERTRRPRVIAADVVDAEYETLAAPERRTAGSPSTPAEAASLMPGLDVLRQGSDTAASAMSGRGVFWTLGLAVVAGAFWISGGHAILGYAASGREAAAPLAVDGVTSRLESVNGRALLLIDGEAVNRGTRTEKLPDLSVDIVRDDGRIAHYFLGTRGRPLAAGERLAFSSRLPAPKEGVRSVSVTFDRFGERKE